MKPVADSFSGLLGRLELELLSDNITASEI